MKYFCIADEHEVLVGVRLVGIEGVLASTPTEISHALNAACEDAEVGIVLVTEACYDRLRERIDTVKLSAHRPLVTIIPTASGRGMREHGLLRLIDEALGTKL